MNRQGAWLVERLEWSRELLLSDLRRVDSAALTWRCMGRSRTVAESIAHIAAVEFSIGRTLIASRAMSQEWMEPEWERRGLGSATVPRSMDACEALLGEVRRLTLSSINRVSDKGWGEPVLWYAEGKEFSDAPLVKWVRRDLAHGLVEHEQYHRGQITLTRFLYTCS